MSISFFIYSVSKQVPSRSQLAAQLQSKGWLVVSVDPDDPTCILPDDALEDDVLLASRSQETAERVRRLVDQKDTAALDELCRRGALASCGVDVTHPYDFKEDYGESDVDELVDSIGRQAVEAMRHAVVHYEIGTSAGRSRLSSEFQQAVWDALGELAGGLMEDPQCGLFQLFENGRKQMLEKPTGVQADPSDLPSLLARFMDQAARSGFPVTGKGFDAEIVTDGLSRDRMEQLLDLLGDCLPDSQAAVFADIFLEEYISGQGESFEVEHADWVEAMRRRYGSSG